VGDALHGLLGEETVMKKKQTSTRGAGEVGCECGGRLRRVVFPAYDFAGYVGFPLTVKNLPGLRCTKCEGETIDGADINNVLNLIVVETVKSPGCLDSRGGRLSLPANDRPISIGRRCDRTGSASRCVRTCGGHGYG
jgi:hypothetical protein